MVLLLVVHHTDMVPSDTWGASDARASSPVPLAGVVGTTVGPAVVVAPGAARKSIGAEDAPFCVCLAYCVPKPSDVE